jgi:hypothetical protein
MLEPFRAPTDVEIEEAQQRLAFRFPAPYVQFLKSCGNVANAILTRAARYVTGRTMVPRTRRGRVFRRGTNRYVWSVGSQGAGAAPNKRNTRRAKTRARDPWR